MPARTRGLALCLEALGVSAPPPMGGLSYVRLYEDQSGESHFQDVELDAHRHGAEICSDALPVGAVVMRQVDPVPAASARHRSPRRQFIVHLEGEVEVETSDGERRRFGPGDVVLVEDVAGRGHVTRALGTGARRTLYLPLPD